MGCDVIIVQVGLKYDIISLQEASEGLCMQVRDLEAPAVHLGKETCGSCRGTDHTAVPGPAGAHAVVADVLAQP